MAYTFHRDDATFSAISDSDITTGTAWTTYTPTITAGAGTFTTVSGAGRFKQLGKSVFIQIIVTVTTNNTASTYVNATLPAAAISNYVLAGRAVGISGKMLMGETSGSNCIIFNYDGSYPAANGEVLLVSGIYEST